MRECQQIPKINLIPGRWYVGRGRNGNVGLWDGEVFLVIGQCGHPESWKPRKWISKPCIKQEPYYSDDDGCFQPFHLIDEGAVLEAIDARYAKSITFDSSIF